MVLQVLQKTRVYTGNYLEVSHKVFSAIAAQGKFFGPTLIYLKHAGIKRQEDKTAKL